MTVDVVLLYVDGRAPGYRALHEALGLPFRPCHVRSLGELRYALRSIETHAPWVDRLFLVVQSDAHLPAWLDRRAVIVVRHDEFIPADRLPTFNQFPIQACLHRIPGLGPRFILWHDDYFLGRPASPRDFFPDGSVAVVRDSPIPLFLDRLRPGDLFARFAVNTARLFHPRGIDRLIGAWLHPHVPLAVRTDQWREMVERFESAPAFHCTIHRKVEADGGDPEGVLLDTLYANYASRAVPRWRRAASCLLLQLGRGLAMTANRLLPTRFPPRYTVYGIRNDPGATARSMRALERDRPRMFCVNDDAYDRFGEWHDGIEVNPASLACFERTMERLYPRPSRFEARSAAVPR
jgi:hypothetical protein